MARGGGVWKPPKLADIICEQPLSVSVRPTYQPTNRLTGVGTRVAFASKIDLSRKYNKYKR